ncbi:MAG: ferredoxin [bacterium]
MADLNNKWEDNVQGSWYVDQSCIMCGLCVELAPGNFKESDDGDHDIVYKQPETDEELEQCRDAKEQCPTESIGNDG